MAEKSTDDKVTVFLLGPSYGAEHNARRVVTKDEAERLVRNGVARYPASKK